MYDLCRESTGHNSTVESTYFEETRVEKILYYMFGPDYDEVRAVSYLSIHLDFKHL